VLSLTSVTLKVWLFHPEIKKLKICNGNCINEFPGEIQETARRKLRMVNNSFDIADLRISPANRPEKRKVI